MKTDFMRHARHHAVTGAWLLCLWWTGCVVENRRDTEPLQPATAPSNSVTPQPSADELPSSPMPQPEADAQAAPASVDETPATEGDGGLVEPDRDQSWDDQGDPKNSDELPSDWPGAVAWSHDFSLTLDDAPEDDRGAGDYRYPEHEPSLEGSADLRRFAAEYDAEGLLLRFELGVTRVTASTKIGLVVLDEEGFRNAGFRHDWAMGGVEIRVPDWNAHGVNFVLCDPASPLLDLAVTKNLDPFGESALPDNAMYIRNAGGAQWLGRDGAPTDDPTKVRRLDVVVERNDPFDLLRVSVPVGWLFGHLDLHSPALYVIPYSYLVLDLPDDSLDRLQFGGLEISAAEGGLADDRADAWRDPDVYDIFVEDSSVTQSEVLTIPAELGATEDQQVVLLNRVGAGVIRIPTGTEVSSGAPAATPADRASATRSCAR